MAKYIDSEKLKERVTRLIASARQNDWPLVEDYLRRVIDIIDSLQQEPPVTKEQISHLEHWLAFFGCPEENIEKCATQIAQGYGAIRYLEGVQHGAEAVNELAQQEQPEVDLNAEIEKELRLHYNDDQDVYWWNYLKNSFYHFYELGLNARKEK